MNFKKCLSWTVLAFAVTVLSQNDARAQNLYVSYVASNGSGTACTRTAPCANFRTAFPQTKTLGTITCLDLGDFGGLRITRAVTIDCSAAGNIGAEGSAALDATPGSACPCALFVIDVPTTEMRRAVRLRGINSVSVYGNIPIIYISSASAVYVENSVLDSINGGIIDKRTGGQTRLYVKDTVIRNSEAPGIIAGSSAVGITVLDNVSLLNNTYGIAVASGNNVMISRSTISGNTTAGVEADGGAQIEVSNSAITHNNIGVQAFGTIRLRENDIKFSNTAIQGNTVSFGANRFSGNGAVGTTPSLVSGAPADLFN